MRTDVRIKKYTDIYNKVNNFYNNDYLSIIKSCEKLDITPRFYYKICKELGKKSVADKDFNKQYFVKNKIDQKGGNKNVDKIIDNEQDSDDADTIFNNIKAGIRNKKIRRGK